MKKITEHDLVARSSKLKEKVIESKQLDEVNWGAIGTGAMNAVKGAGSAIATGAQKAGQAVTGALGSTAGKLGMGAALGAGAMAAGQAVGASTPATAPATAPKSDPAVLKLQQDLIAKGAKIKADGVMGPATAAAQKQFGGSQATAPAGTTDTAPAPAISPDKAVALAMQGQQAASAPVAGGNGTWDGQEQPSAPAAAPTGSAALNPANGSAATTIPSGPQTVPGQQGSAALNPAVNGDKATSIPSGPGTAASNAPTGSAALDPAKNPNTATNIPGGASVVPGAPRATANVQNNANSSVQAESVGFRNDELSRIISLVHHR